MDPGTQQFLQDLKLILHQWCLDYFHWKSLNLRKDIIEDALEFAYEMDLRRSEAENKEYFEKFLRKHTKPLIQKAGRDKKYRGYLSCLDQILLLDGESRRLMILHQILGKSSRSISEMMKPKVHHTTVSQKIKKIREQHGLPESSPLNPSEIS